MSFTKQQLTFMKRALISARVHVQEVSAVVQRAGERTRAVRLREIADRIADELDDLDRLLANLP